MRSKAVWRRLSREAVASALEEGPPSSIVATDAALSLLRFHSSISIYFISKRIWLSGYFMRDDRAWAPCVARPGFLQVIICAASGRR